MKYKSDNFWAELPPVLTACEAADILQMSARTVERYVKRQKLRALDTYHIRISADELRRFIEGGRHD